MERRRSSVSSPVKEGRERYGNSTSVVLPRYLNSGLWRDVWSWPDGGRTTHQKPQPSGDDEDSDRHRVVLKMLKPEYELTTRNFDRHRREAVVMERLTTVPQVMDLYAYCGNSIVTEYAPLGPLDGLVMMTTSKQMKATTSGRPPPPLRRGPWVGAAEATALLEEESEQGTENLRIQNVDVDTFDEADDARMPDEHENLLENPDQFQPRGLRGRNGNVVRDNQNNEMKSGSYHTYKQVSLMPHQRLQLSLQASKAIESLHRNDIIHADLTAKQFLLVNQVAHREEKEHDKMDGRLSFSVKINDFNRCRFVPRKTKPDNDTRVDDKHALSPTPTNSSSSTCTIQIPSAPGLYRSPEEYTGKKLTKQIDIFSLGHILYEIWFGESPWKDIGGRRVRDMVQDGTLPQGLQSVLDKGKKNDVAQDFDLNLAMGGLISRCYEVHPAKRITASQLVEELSLLIKGTQ